jgi:hypothetical protein
VVQPDLALGVLRLQALQELDRLLVGVITGPAHRGRGRGREDGGVDLARDRKVMVAHQAQLAALGHQLGALVGLRAVADHVAQAPDLLDPGLVDRGQHGLGGREIAVDVGEDGDSHGNGARRGPASSGLSYGCAWPPD